MVASAALVLGALLVRDLELLGALAGWGFRAGGGAAAAASPALLRPLLAAGGSELLGFALILVGGLPGGFALHGEQRRRGRWIDG